MKQITIVFTLLFLLLGCTASEEGETAVSSPNNNTEESQSIQISYVEGGQNPDGTFFRGVPDAPITLILKTQEN